MTRAQETWLFSRRLDLTAFLAPALISLLLVLIGIPLGLVNGETRDTPPVVWLLLVVFVDVAHVWGNLLLVYTDPHEWRRRALLWSAIPAAMLALALALVSESELWLWRAAAALAVWHFVRQQVGWIKLYRARNHDERAGWCARFVDEGAIYAATLAPIVWWHAHLPRPFWWLAAGDFFIALPAWLGTAALSIEATLLSTYAIRSALAHRRGHGVAGKDIVIGSTALLWWLGIVWCESDYVFTVTNVLTHGVPYAILIWLTAQRRAAAGASVALPLRFGLVCLLLALIGCAWLEEALWDRLLWHEHTAFFPLPAIDIGSARPWLLAVLITPQLTHYMLDAFLWRRRDNPFVLAGVRQRVVASSRA